ncbi:MAG: ligase-associated DNA damage response endonuclease PdeM [Bacteroidia bacterium]
MQSIALAGQEMLLLPEKAMFWVEQRWLLIADVHLGKAAHFRKHGSAIPTGVKNLDTISSLVKRWKPTKVIFMGDLFHSSRNADWDRLCVFTKREDSDFVLIKGNHDLLTEQDYRDASLEVIPESILLDGLLLRHDPSPHGSEDGYELAGHVHPGIRLEGDGRQYLRLPCFAFGHRQGLMPAFGEFTGLHIIDTNRYRNIYAVADGEVLPVK